MILLLCAGLALAGELSGFVVPTFSYDTDDGPGLGGRFELARKSPGFDPYRWSIMAQGSVTAGGFQYHRMRWDQLGLGPEGRGRLLIRAGYKAWTRDGYWGIGARTGERPACPGKGVSQPNCVPADYYEYALQQPLASVTWRQDLAEGGPWSAFGAVAGRLSTITLHRPSQLAVDQPLGVEGGLDLPLTAGLLYDTRSPEIAPQGGVFVELAAMVAPPVQGQLWGGPHAGISTYVPLGGRVVWAHRTMAEWLFGAVPFTEMVNWIGYDPPTPGFGGANTLRGIRYGRWRGPGKAVVDQELRLRLFHHEAFGRLPLTYEVAPFVDLAAVSGEADDPIGPPLHGSAGLGLRLIVDETFVGRVDAGYGADVAACAGCPTTLPTLGVYVAFDHPF